MLRGVTEVPTRPGGGRFPETHWSSLLEVGDPSDPRHREHLDRLLRRYWKPVYCYVRAMRRGPAEDAEDLTQGFFAMVLARVDFAALSPERGSFRGFLKTALRRYVATVERTGAARVRRGETPLFPFAEAEALGRPGEAPDPDEAFDRAWARDVLAEALARLERELAADGKQVYFEVFRRYALDPPDDVTYERVAREHGLKADDVRNYLRVVRLRGREIIKELVRDYLLPGESVEEELRFVFSR